MNYFYYIVENVRSSNKQLNLPYKYTIERIPIDCPFQLASHPFTSLKQLKRYSKIYNDFKLVNPKGAKKICEDRFIHKLANIVLTPSDPDFNNYSWDLLRHTVHGKIEKEFSGLHLICSLNQNIRSIIETKSPDINGVWEAEITIYSETKDKEFTKISTLFPKHWTPNDFMVEIYYAFKNMNKKNDKEYMMESKTKSNVPVCLIIKDEKLLSSYPIYTEK
jgi:hypothetical protein